MSTGTVDIQQYQSSNVYGIFNSKHIHFPLIHQRVGLQKITVLSLVKQTIKVLSFTFYQKKDRKKERKANFLDSSQQCRIRTASHLLQKKQQNSQQQGPIETYNILFIQVPNSFQILPLLPSVSRSCVRIIACHELVCALTCFGHKFQTRFGHCAALLITFGNFLKNGLSPESNDRLLIITRERSASFSRTKFLQF